MPAELKRLVVVQPGLEPRQTEPKSVVLPLHHRTKFPRHEIADE